MKTNLNRNVKSIWQQCQNTMVRFEIKNHDRTCPLVLCERM